MHAYPVDETDPILRLEPRRTALLAGHPNTLEVLVRVQAPPCPARENEPSLPLNLAFVLDRSGSMRGRPLAEAGGCALAMIERLDACDRAALVVFDHRVKTLVASQPVTDPRVFQRALATVHDGGRTNLHGGWRQGAAEVTRTRLPAGLHRIILLSDGQANEGLCDAPALARQCAAEAETGVTTSTYGLGHHFNEELMVEMARAGRGNAYYSDTADDLLDKFAEEFALLQALCARQLQLLARTPPGVRYALLNDYIAEGVGLWCLPDLAYGSEAWAVLRLQIDREHLDAASDQPVPVLEVELAWTDRAGSLHSGGCATLALPALPAAAFGAVAENMRVTARLAELDCAGLQRQARLAARQGDWPRVEQLLDRARRRAVDHPWLEAVVSEMEQLMVARDAERFSKESYYSSERMTSRLAARDERPGEPTRDEAVPTYLRRLARQGKKGT